MATTDILAEDFDAEKLTVPRLRNLLITHHIEYKSDAKKPELVRIARLSLAPDSSPYRKAQREARLTKAWQASANKRQLGKGIVEVQKDGREHIIGVDSSPRAYEAKVKRESPEAQISPGDSPDSREESLTRKRSRSRKAIEAAQAESQARSKARKTGDSTKQSSAREPTPKRARDISEPSIETSDSVRARKKQIKTEADEQLAASSLRTSRRLSETVPTTTAETSDRYTRPSLDDPVALFLDQEEPPRSKRTPTDAVWAKDTPPSSSPLARRRANVNQADSLSRIDATPPMGVLNDLDEAGMTSDRAERRKKILASKASQTLEHNAQVEPRVGQMQASPLTTRPLVPSLLGPRTQSSSRRDGGQSRFSAIPPRSPIRFGLSTFGNGSPGFEKQIHQRLKPVTNERSRLSQTDKTKPRKLFRSIFKAMTWFVLAALTTSILLTGRWYYRESLRLGYCDQDGTRTLNARRLDTAESDLEFWHTEQISIPLIDQLNLAPVCKPCPTQGHCSEGRLASCAEGFVPSYPVFSQLWPLKADCQPDTERITRIISLSNGIADSLKVYRGDVMCGKYKSKHARGMSASSKWGRDLESIRDEVFTSPSLQPLRSREIWSAALEELHSRSDIIFEQNSRNETVVYATEAVIGWGCQARLFIRATIAAYWPWIFFPALMALWLSRFVAKRRHKAAIKAQVPGLVRLVLGVLQEQEQLHYTNISLAPYPYVSSTQLRDKILSDQHSASERALIWSHVTDSVESNANVRVREAEMRGELWRAWEWVGGAERHLATDNAASTQSPRSIYPHLTEMMERT